jgi:hypothetical protein
MDRKTYGQYYYKALKTLVAQGELKSVRDHLDEKLSVRVKEVMACLETTGALKDNPAIDLTKKVAKPRAKRMVAKKPEVVAMPKKSKAEKAAEMARADAIIASLKKPVAPWEYKPCSEKQWKDQAKIMDDLEAKGYHVVFGWGADGKKYIKTRKAA